MIEFPYALWRDFVLDETVKLKGDHAQFPYALWRDFVLDDLN